MMGTIKFMSESEASLFHQSVALSIQNSFVGIEQRSFDPALGSFQQIEGNLSNEFVLLQFLDFNLLTPPFSLIPFSCLFIILIGYWWRLRSFFCTISRFTETSVKEFCSIVLSDLFILLFAAYLQYYCYFLLLLFQIRNQLQLPFQKSIELLLSLQAKSSFGIISWSMAFFLSFSNCAILFSLNRGDFSWFDSEDGPVLYCGLAYPKIHNCPKNAKFGTSIPFSDSTLLFCKDDYSF